MVEHTGDATPWDDESGAPETSAPVTDVGEAPGDDETLSLAAATRLVEPMRFNNLTPAEISGKHLRRATREMRRAQRGLRGVAHEGHRVIAKARVEAQTGQRLARLNLSKRRARKVQFALRRADHLRVRYDALQEERARYARKIAAARDLITAWQAVTASRNPLDRQAASVLIHASLAAAREERSARERLDDTERALHHLDAAEEAMRRDSDATRLDPLTFRRFAGRGRWRVRLGIAVVVAALLTLLYPPWSPPKLGATCETGVACARAHASAPLRLENSGSGVLIGWLTASVQSTGSLPATQVIPVVLLPQSSRTLTCGDLGTCTLTPAQSAKVQISTSGGSASVTIIP